MADRDYLPKLKMGLGLPFGEHYLHASSIKMFLNQLTKFQCYTFFSSQDIKQNMLLSSYLDY